VKNLGERTALPGRSLFRRIDEILAGEGWVKPEFSSAIRSLQSESPGPSPLVLEIATRLLGLTQPRVALLTGFVVPKLFPQGENDGPLGSIVLGQTLARIGFEPTLFTDPPLVETARWLTAEIGGSFPVRSLSQLDMGDAWNSFDAVIAIEKPGANERGVMHTFDGNAIRHGSLQVDALFHACRRACISTFAIGDRGNEAGFGTIREAVQRVFPHTVACQCGCGAGILAASCADFVLPAAVSNWGAYGVVAALALLAERPDLAHTPAAEERLLRVAAVRGCADGVLRRSSFGVDGLPGQLSVGVVAALHRVVQEAAEHQVEG